MFTFIDTDRSIQAHRKPTKGEINRGYGAIHYKDFPRSLWVSYIVGGKAKFNNFEDANEYANNIFNKQKIIVSIEQKVKKWIVCPIDGLRYYR
jgi:hypothetical protein